MEIKFLKISHLTEVLFITQHFPRKTLSEQGKYHHWFLKLLWIVLEEIFAAWINQPPQKPVELSRVIKVKLRRLEFLGSTTATFRLRSERERGCANTGLKTSLERNRGLAPQHLQKRNLSNAEVHEMITPQPLLYITMAQWGEGEVRTAAVTIITHRQTRLRG